MTFCRFCSFCPAHPRSRGEHNLRTDARQTPCGSSPLARGTRTPHPHRQHPRRLIPARAGNTRCGMYGSRPSAAHPRSRGEHGDHLLNDHGTSGPSPLARGTPPEVVPDVHQHRLIPARAGNTALRVASIRAASAHPRSRGEHTMHSVMFIFAAGSSPLARGTPDMLCGVWLVHRLIPARAGNTSPVSVS